MIWIHLGAAVTIFKTNTGARLPPKYPALFFLSLRHHSTTFGLNWAQALLSSLMRSCLGSVKAARQWKCRETSGVSACSCSSNRAPNKPTTRGSRECWQIKAPFNLVNLDNQRSSFLCLQHTQTPLFSIFTASVYFHSYLLGPKSDHLTHLYIVSLCRSTIHI